MIPTQNFSPSMKHAVCYAAAIATQKQEQLITPIYMFVGLMRPLTCLYLMKILQNLSISSDTLQEELLNFVGEDVNPYTSTNDIPQNITFSSQMRNILEFAEDEAGSGKKQGEPCIDSRGFMVGCANHNNNSVLKMLTELRPSLAVIIRGTKYPL